MDNFVFKIWKMIEKIKANVNFFSYKLLNIQNYYSFGAFWGKIKQN